MNKYIAVVDDEPDILDLVSLHLEKSGFKVKGFADGESFLKSLDKKRPDLAVLDLMLPDADGLEICKHLKTKASTSEIPIIMLTAKGEEIDRILGLELGADDYITKPFSVKELVARVKAVLRRSEKQAQISSLFIGDDVSIDVEKHEVRLSGRVLELTSTEFRILTLLASKKGWVFTRDQILDFLWGHEKAVLDRTVDVHIKHLRDKMKEAAGYIKNVRGVGYKLEE